MNTKPEGATHNWHTGVRDRDAYLKVDGDGVAVWQLQNGGYWQWIGNTLDDISGLVQPLVVSPNLQIETYAAAIQAVEGAAKEFAVTEAKRMLADPTDELGKVWDVLHAAGINSGGELSASEGVKLLADKAKWAVPPFPQPRTMEEFIGLHMNKEVPLDPSLITGNGCDHDWFAPYGQKSQQCRKCDAVRG